ncbi:L-dopachrome tautomerase-related protein [Kozakia baliensis]|uniref:L-dopachrome tautomerase-related protein n=1 Tax=Kozakia baliensis TaxID=153496 RepID=UPI00345BAD12
MACLKASRIALSCILAVGAFAAAGFNSAHAQQERPWVPAPIPAKVEHVSSLVEGEKWHGVVLLANGVIVAERENATSGPLVISVDPQDRISPFPDASWNDPHVQGPHFVHPTAITTDEQGKAWLLDNGSADISPRLIQIDGPPNVHSLPRDVVMPQSRFTALVVHQPFAYLADQGTATLVVLNLKDGTATRFFTNDPALRGRRPMFVDGVEQRGKNDLPLARDISMLALQKDGAWIYEQPPCGPLYRVSTALLTDPNYSPIELMESLAQWRDTPTLGGLTISSDNTLYMIDIAQGRLLSFDAGRLPHILLQDPRLTQAGAPIIGADGKLYVASGNMLLRIVLP